MKIIRYLYRHTVNIGTEESPNYVTTEIEKMPRYSEEALAIAQREAYNGEYTIEDDGQPEPSAEPTQLDRVEAQATYTAMMTDTLLEG